MTLEKGKTFKVKAKIKLMEKKKKLLSEGHGARIRFISTNTAIATVSKAGKIRAKAPGKCKIYAVAINGLCKTVTVTVKE